MHSRERTANGEKFQVWYTTLIPIKRVRGENNVKRRKNDEVYSD